MERISADNKTTYTARIRIKGYRQQTATFPRITDARLWMKQAGTPLPNLFAGGGAAQGVSGPAVWGYLSGNGLLTAFTLGRIAG